MAERTRKLKWLSGGWADLAGTEDRALRAPTLPDPLGPMFPTSGGGPAPLNVNTGNILSVSDAWSCVQLYANAISTLPLHAFRKAPTGRVPAGEGARITQLLQRPAPGQTRIDLVSQIVTHMCVYGEAFIGLYRGADGEVAQLGLLHPGSVDVEQRAQTIAYTLRTKDGRVELGVESVVHIKGVSVDGLRGLSPVSQCATALGLSSSLQASAKGFTERGSRPSGILTAPANLTPQQFNEFQDIFDMNHSGGVETMHRVAVLSGDCKFEPIAFSQSDAEFLGQRELSAREVARIFGLPSWAIGGSSGDSLTYSNTREQNAFLVTHSLRPLATRIEEAISASAELMPTATYVEFSFDGLLRADAKTRAETYEKAITNEWMTVREVRELENLPND